MFNMTVATQESADTVLEMFDRFNIEGLSLEVVKGEFHITDSKTDALYFTGEYVWEVDEFLSDIDHECFCDGSDDGQYTCTFPPCVAAGEADMKFYGAMFRAAQSVSEVVAYERNDPKHPDYAESIIDRIDAGRI